MNNERNTQACTLHAINYLIKASEKNGYILQIAEGSDPMGKRVHGDGKRRFELNIILHKKVGLALPRLYQIQETEAEDFCLALQMFNLHIFP
jgi:hypothetical protein